MILKDVTQLDDSLYCIKSPFSCGADIFVYTYLVVGSKGAALIDGGISGTDQQVIELLDKLGFPPTYLSALLLTHAHADHAGAANALREETGCAVIGHRFGVPLIRNKELMYQDFMGAYPAQISVPNIVREQWFSIAGPPAFVDVQINKGQFQIDLGGFLFEAVFSPGHSLDHMCYYEKDQQWLFSGDGICGNGPYNEPPCYRDATVYRDTLMRLMALDIKRLFPGHSDVLEKDGATDFIRESLQVVEILDQSIKNYLQNPRAHQSLEAIGVHVAECLTKDYMVQALFTAEAHLCEMERLGLVARYGVDQPSFVWL